MRISSEPRGHAEGSNPSPVRRRLEKAPSPDTLSPRERAICPTKHPRSPAKDMGNDQPQGRGYPASGVFSSRRGLGEELVPLVAQAFASVGRVAHTSVCQGKPG